MVTDHEMFYFKSLIDAIPGFLNSLDTEHGGWQASSAPPLNPRKPLYHTTHGARWLAGKLGLNPKPRNKAPRYFL